MVFLINRKQTYVKYSFCTAYNLLLDDLFKGITVLSTINALNEDFIFVRFVVNKNKQTKKYWNELNINKMN